MTQPIPDTLRATRRALSNATEELARFHDDVLTAPTLDDSRTQLLLREVRELKGELARQLLKFSVQLPDGRHLLRPQFETMLAFAANNSVPIEKALNSVIIEGTEIVECAFRRLGIQTLEGLEGLWSLRLLDVMGNPSLTSLRGVPTGALSELFACCCGITGNLSHLSGAEKLKAAWLSRNKGLSSLHGIPTQEIRVLDASMCGLSGDLSDISGATELAELCINNNRNLVSLKGIPTHNIQQIQVNSCGLTGDLSEIAQARKLKILGIANNRGVTSLKGIPIDTIEFIDARSCSLVGDHTFVIKAPKITELKLEDNCPTLAFDRDKIKRGVVISL